MENGELMIIGLNVVVILVAYLSIYPKLAGQNINKISFYDLFVSGFVVLLVGSKYWGSGVEFNLIFTTVNWLWFTLVTYFLIEVPVLIWYFTKNKGSI